MARPKIHTSAAERRAAHLADKDRFDLIIQKHLGSTVREVAVAFEASNNEVLEDLIRFALTNRNWKQSGLLWGKSGTEKKPD